MHFSKTLVAASLAASGASATPFTLLTENSGTSFQHLPLSAFNLTVGYGADATIESPPPQYDGSAILNNTSFNWGADDGIITMNIAGTGIQYFYIAPQTGFSEITSPHTDYIPNGGISNFTIGPGPNPQLTSADGFQSYLCGDGPYYLEWGVPALITTNCVGVDLLVQYQESDAAGAWEYD